MAKEIIGNGESGLVVRGKLNDNFTELYKNKVNVFNAIEYGLIGDGVTDNTVTLQTLIQTCWDADGGKIVFPNGIYVFDGALQTNVGGINYNSQLYIPMMQLGTDRTRRSITFEGESVPNMMQSLGLNTTPVVPSSGVIFKSTITGSGIKPSIISAGLASGGTILDNNDTDCHFENIQFQPVPNVSNQITIGGLNLRRCRNTTVKKCSCFPFNVNLWNSASPLNSCVGIEMPELSCEHINVIEDTNVGGFYSGIVSGEHTVLRNTISMCCVNNYEFTANYHTALGYSLKSFWGINDIKVSGGISNFKIDHLQIEWGSQGRWYDNQYTILDTSNYGVGEIIYNIVEVSVGINQTRFSRSGGANIRAACLDGSVNILTTNGSYFGDIINAIVDTNAVGFGALLAQAADFHFDEADADTISTCKVLAIALQSGTGIKKILLKGQICNTSWNWSAGTIYASVTQGTLSQTAPVGTDDVVVIIGWALSPDTIYFAPYASYLELT